MNRMLQSDGCLKFVNMTLSNTFSKFKTWLSYNFFWCNAAAIISGLVFSYKVVNKTAVEILITYFTDDIFISRYSLLEAAVFVKIKGGLSASFVIVMTYISGALISPVTTTGCASASYIAGLVLLFLTASKLFPRSVVNLYNIMGIVLLAVGEAGVLPFIGEVLADQLRAHEPEENKDEDRVMARKTVWWCVAWCCSLIASFLVYLIMQQVTDDYYSWIEILRISASMMGSIFILFLAGIPFYHTTGRDGVEKTAILTESSSSSNPGPEEQEETQVKKSKLLLKMVPMWTTFLVFGLVLSTVNTFFPEQASHMDLRGFGFTVYFLLEVKFGSRATASYVIKKLLLSKWVRPESKKQANILIIWAGMVLSIFCCAVAWRVEVRRLQIVSKKGLLYYNLGEKSQMSILWLVPQLCLLGLMEGLAADGLEEFMVDQIPEASSKYVLAINGIVINGIGSFLGIVFIYANRSLFADTLTGSRLDVCYQRLALLSFVNLCYYWFISTIYTRSQA